MGIQLWGAFGGFQKKTGALVGRWLKGQNVITAIPHPSSKPPTVAQLNYRIKFGMMVDFLRPISQIVKIGFKNAHAEKQTAWNAAYAYNYKKAMTGIGPAYTIDYAKVVVSMGILSTVYDCDAEAILPESLKFSWTAAFNEGNGALTDRITLVTYSPVLNKYVYLTNAAARSALTFTLSMPFEFKDQQVHCYLYFVSADGKFTSNSVYLGPVYVL